MTEERAKELLIKMMNNFYWANSSLEWRWQAGVSLDDLSHHDSSTLTKEDIKDLKKLKITHED